MKEIHDLNYFMSFAAGTIEYVVVGAGHARDFHFDRGHGPLLQKRFGIESCL
jgi:hypothetical protein